MAADVFPTTQNTWIADELRTGRDGRQNVNFHLMKTYAWPLRVYYLGTNLRWLGEPDDVIGGFFESRLGQELFLEKWRRSGIRLRRWLMNAFCFYLMELRKQRMRHKPPIEVGEEPVTFVGDPEAAIDRAAVVAFVRHAMEEAAQECVKEGLEAHWGIFLRHQVDGTPFRRIADEFHVDSARAAVMSRTATRKFRRALREVLVRDGVAEDQCAHEIQLLLESSGR